MISLRERIAERERLEPKLTSEATLWFDNNCDDFYQPIREYFECLSLADLKAAFRTPRETIALFDRRHKMIAEFFFDEYSTVLI